MDASAEISASERWRCPALRLGGSQSDLTGLQFHLARHRPFASRLQDLLTSSMP